MSVADNVICKGDAKHSIDESMSRTLVLHAYHRTGVLLDEHVIASNDCESL